MAQLQLIVIILLLLGGVFPSPSPSIERTPFAEFVFTGQFFLFWISSSENAFSLSFLQTSRG
jgi:hypothetical protein